MAKVATPKAAPPAGAYASGQTVTVTCSTVGSTIFYTTDGSSPTHTAGTPTGTTSIYTTPLSISLGTTLKALGYLVSDTDSNVLTAAYIQGYTVSGNLGKAGANATVAVIGNAVSGGNQGQQEQICIPVTADSSGNYTTPALAPNTVVIPNYQIIPILFGVEFSPFNQTVIVTNANITGVNWTGPYSYYTLVQDFSDTCNRGGVTQNPAVGWTTSSASGTVPMEIVADAIQCSQAGQIASAFPAGYTPQSDCYFSYTIVTMSRNDAVEMILRDTTVGVQTGFESEFAATAGTNNATFQLNDVASESALFTGYGFLPDEPDTEFTFNVGDQLVFVCRGISCYLFRVPVGTGTYVSLAAAQSVGVTLSPGISSITISDIIGATNLTSFKNIVGGFVQASSGPSGGGNSSWLSVAANNMLRGSRSH